MKDRVLVYTCCDKKYTDFIPIFCASLLSANDNVDIEIGISVDRLTYLQELALDKLRELHSDATILIKYNYFQEIGNKKAIVDDSISDLPIEVPTIRFVTEPQIKKDKYVYITDVDIVSLDKNFYIGHINDMRENNRCYSNIVRKEGIRLSGLHFALSEMQYPLDLKGIDLTRRNEFVFYEVVSKKFKMDYDATYRPVHGIHMSLNRPSVSGTDKIPGWFPKEWDYCEDNDNYKKKWYEFKQTEDYRCIVDAINESELITSLVAKLENYYRLMPYIWIYNPFVKAYDKIRKIFSKLKCYLGQK